MATTVKQSFLILKKNLEITDLQNGTVSTRQTNLREVMENGFTIKDSFLTGSYSRKTMIAPLNEADVDVFFVLHSDYFSHYNGTNGGPAGLLDYVKRTLRKTYTQTPDISRNGQAVSIRFTDFVVDVVPGFSRSGGGYLIPSSITQTWIETDPKKHVELVSQANAYHGQSFIPIIKMIKGWNRSNQKVFRSFHLEVLALSVFQDVDIVDYSSGVRFFFEKARALVTQKNPDPAGYGDDVGRYLNTQEKIDEAKRKLSLAYDRAVKAEDFCRRGIEEDAIDMWRKIFGEYFPAYG